MAQFNPMSRCAKLRLVLSDDKFISVSIQFNDTNLIDRTNANLVPVSYLLLIIPPSKLQCNQVYIQCEQIIATLAYTSQHQNGIMFVTDRAFDRKKP
ncbi:conserved hypothetical protein [Vibrio crassostreae]|nr:conserved hypothetical protein [Vibrio crassostreae]CAK1934608.1 conserved hypothetical protein [Vibrio crassostreae]CAK1935891.1 conserved hypothetical protein [Vibrio crassostreae]CAK1937837.1 conserved hypothetical protein [Vibrio crassostreae]CAK1940021.1 conserved hypothetical protein [Vibrio crassostreae]